MIWHSIAQIQPTEPATRKVEVNLFAKTTFRPNTEAIPHQQHADQQFRINRRAACVAEKRGQMLADAGQLNKPVNGTKQVILWDVIVNRELVKQRTLLLLLWP